MENKLKLSRNKFKFVTLGKIETSLKNNESKYINMTHSTKNSNLLKGSKADNKYLKTNFNFNKKHLNQGSSTVSKTIDTDEFKKEVNNRVNSLLNEKSSLPSIHKISLREMRSDKFIQLNQESTYTNKSSLLEPKQEIQSIYERVILKNEPHENFNENEKKVILRLNKFCENQYFSLISAQMVKQLTNPISGNNSRKIYLNNLVDYAEKDTNFQLHRKTRKGNIKDIPLDFQEKYWKKFSYEDNNASNFYERIPLFEKRIQDTFDKISQTKMTYNKIKEAMFHS